MLISGVSFSTVVSMTPQFHPCSWFADAQNDLSIFPFLQSYYFAQVTPMNNKEWVKSMLIFNVR